MEEPNALIRWVIYLFGGGDAGLVALCGLGAITASAILFPDRRFSRPQVYFAAVFLCLATLCCASPPMPLWFQIGSVIGLFAVGLHLVRKRSSKPKHQRLAMGLLAVWFLGAIGWQIPYLTWSPRTFPCQPLLIVGDSITAGLNDGDDTWPRQLAKMVNYPVLDASQPGATLKSARKQISRFGDGPGLLILEIGGNDLLEGLPVHEFTRDLDRLLADAKRPGRTIVMFELPLPPLCSRHGSAQRELARKYGVHLVPKRLFAGVLTTKGATVDGIHLSDQGHTVMANLIKYLLAQQLGPGTDFYVRVEQ